MNNADIDMNVHHYTPVIIALNLRITVLVVIEMMATSERETAPALRPLKTRLFPSGPDLDAFKMSVSMSRQIE